VKLHFSSSLSLQGIVTGWHAESQKKNSEGITIAQQDGKLKHITEQLDELKTLLTVAGIESKRGMSVVDLGFEEGGFR
jgi:hypothetical protein